MGLFEVLARPLVFPAEAVLFPHVGKPALVAGRLRNAPGNIDGEKLGVLHDTLLEAERVVPGRVGLDRRRHAQHPAKIAEMILIRGRFLAGKLRPFRFEFRRVHRWRNGLAGGDGDDKPEHSGNACNPGCFRRPAGNPTRPADFPPFLPASRGEVGSLREFAKNGTRVACAPQRLFHLENAVKAQELEHGQHAGLDIVEDHLSVFHWQFAIDAKQ